ncbi:hypothetical protein EDC04DRAFT_2615630 [Pisolithus marmoratus]|nr:hypothetical protein EDC04DRAFT_2615630 [Pisolithus marmoratus]
MRSHAGNSGAREVAVSCQAVSRQDIMDEKEDVNYLAVRSEGGYKMRKQPAHTLWDLTTSEYPPSNCTRRDPGVDQDLVIEVRYNWQLKNAPSTHEMKIEPEIYRREMIARLGQSFGLLILLQKRNGDYKRVAAENEIVGSGLGTNITSKNIRTKVLEIL